MSYQYCFASASDGFSDISAREGRIVLPPLSTVVTETTHRSRTDRGWVSYKTCFSEEKAKSSLNEMCEVSMLNGLQWISDGEKFMEAKGQTIGSKKLYKCQYYDHSQCPFRVRVVKTPQYCGVSCISVSYLFDIQYTSKTPHADHVHQDTGECVQFSQMPFDIVSTPSLTHACV